jgi:hypothetical protein
LNINSFHPTNKIDCEYDKIKHNKIKEYYYSYYINNWNIFYYGDYFYNKDNLLTKRIFTPVEDIDDNYKYMDSILYYNNNNISEIMYYRSSYKNDNYFCTDKVFYIYDKNNNLDSIYNYMFHDTDYVLIGYYVYHYSKIPTAVPENINNTENNLTISPNPASDKLEISYISEENSFADISIKNIFGNNVINLLNLPIDRGNNKFNIDINNLASGIYFCNMKINSHSVMKKFIVVK